MNFRRTHSLFISVFSLFVALVLTSCEFWQQPIRGYFEEWTEECSIAKYELVGIESYTDKDGNLCIASDHDAPVKLYLINPYHYNFNGEYTLHITKSQSFTPNITPDPNDTTVLHFTYLQSDLESKEGGEEIGGTLTMHHPVNPTLKEFTFSLKCNSRPPEVVNPAIMLQEYPAASNNKYYVLAFELPTTDSTGGIHKDIESITIDGTTYPITIDASGNMTFEDDKFNGSTPNPSLELLNKRFTHSPNAMYFYSGILAPTSDDEKRAKTFTIGYTDKAGLKTTKTVEAKLPAIAAPTVEDNDGNCLTDDGTVNTLHINYDPDNVAYTTITLTLPDVDDIGETYEGGAINCKLYGTNGNEITIATGESDDPTASSSTGSDGTVTLKIHKEGDYTLQTFTKASGHSNSATKTYKLKLAYADLDIPVVTKNTDPLSTSINNYIELDPDKNYSTVTISAPSTASFGLSVSGVSIEYKLYQGMTETDTPAYSSTGPINLTNMTLGQWTLVVTATKTGYHSSTATYHIRPYASDLYVKSSSASGNQGSDTEGDGSLTKPYATIERCIQEIQVINKSTANYTIHIIETLTGAQTIDGGYLNDKAAKLTIKGESTGILYGNSSAVPLSITTTVPVFITDLKITGGNGDYGGGLYCKADVTLQNGVEISENNATYSGGGIYLKTGSLTIENGVTISGNSATYGGGIYINSNNGCNVTINGGEIKGNNATDGGAIYNLASLTIKGGTISSNSAVTSGGGIYNAETLTMTSGTIGGSGESDLNTVTGTSGKGGAVYQNGTFNISGDANLYFSGNTEKTNDVYLETYTESGTTILRKVNVASSLSNSTVATLTPGRWKRGDKVISGAADANITGSYTKFKVSDAEWTVGKYVSGTATADMAARIGADLWVAGTSLSSDVGSSVTGGKSPSNSNRGTKKQPYADIATAVNECWDTTQNVEFIINVDGTVTGAQTIGNGSTINAKSLTITGYKTSGDSRATLNAGATSTAKKTALTINTGAKTFPITITNLIIKKGINTNGGGIYLTKGTLKLGNGVKVEQNEATSSGGGVYVDSNGILLMYGSAMVGEGTESYPSTSNPQGNKAAFGGAGIYNNQGIVALGYTAYTSESSNTKATGDDAFTGGVCRNLSTTTESGNTNSGGAGIYNYKGTVSVNGGRISFNDCASKGGAIRNGNGGTEKVYIHAGTIKYNKAAKGGAIYVQSGSTVELKGGLLTSNSATTNGGAVYQDGTFKVSGNAYITPGSAQLDNDVYLASTSKYIEVTDTLTPKSDGTSSGTAVSYTAAITPSEWTRGTQVLTGTYASDNYGKFKGSESDWLTIKDTNDSNKVKLYTSYNIYVAGSENRATGIGEPKTKANGGLGTKAKPYASIDEAVAQCWDTASTKTKTFTIYVSGVIKDAKQTISASITNAKEILLQGYGTYHSINRNLSSVNTNSGSALSIGTAVPVKITNMTITGGYASSGGGIYIGGNGQVYLGDGVVITGNKTTSNGGGVAVAEGAKLFLYGTARIGGSGTSLATDSTGNYTEGYGAGIHSQGSVYLGYSACNSSTGVPTTETSLSGGVTQNYAAATSSGGAGGIYVGQGKKLYMKSGNISYNYSGKKGGGVFLDNSGATMTMAGGTIAGNKATTDGGGVYIFGTSSTGYLVMTGGTIGNSSASNPAENTSGKYSNYAASGGGIYADAKTSVSITGGSVNYNYATYGGGLYWQGDSLTVNSNSLHISYNGAIAGGGIYFNSNGTLTQAQMNKNQAMTGGGILINNSKKVTVNGALKIQNCKADGGSGSAYGGGIYNSPNAELTVSGSMTLSSNSAVTSGSSSYAQGGGIYNEGTVTWSAGTVSSNTCSNVTNGNGGAVYQKGTFTIKGGTFTQGTALRNNDIYLPNSKFVTVSSYSNTSGNPTFSFPDSNYKIGTLVIKKDSNWTEADGDSFGNFILYRAKIIKRGLYSGVTKYSSGSEIQGVLALDTSATGLSYSDISTYVQGKTWTQQTSFSQLSEGISYYIFKETSSPDSYAIIRVNNRKTSTYAGKIDCSATIRTDDPSGFQNGGISGTDMEYNCSQYSTAHTWYNHDVFCHNSVGDTVNTCIHFKSNSSTSGIGMFWSDPLYAIKIN